MFALWSHDKSPITSEPQFVHQQDGHNNNQLSSVISSNAQ